MARARSKPALTLDEHKALGAELYAMHERVLAIATDLGERYPARLRETGNRTAVGVTALAHALDDVLWKEQRGLVDRGTLSAVYFPDVPGSAADREPPAPAVPKTP
jgi:hypothetical protein